MLTGSIPVFPPTERKKRNMKIFIIVVFAICALVAFVEITYFLLEKYASDSRLFQLAKNRAEKIVCRNKKADERNSENAD